MTDVGREQPPFGPEDELTAFLVAADRQDPEAAASAALAAESAVNFGKVLAAIEASDITVPPDIDLTRSDVAFPNLGGSSDAAINPQTLNFLLAFRVVWSTLDMRGPARTEIELFDIEEGIRKIIFHTTDSDEQLKWLRLLEELTGTAIFPSPDPQDQKLLLTQYVEAAQLMIRQDLESHMVTDYIREVVWGILAEKHGTHDELEAIVNYITSAGYSRYLSSMLNTSRAAEGPRRVRSFSYIDEADVRHYIGLAEEFYREAMEGGQRW